MKNSLLDDAMEKAHSTLPLTSHEKVVLREWLIQIQAKAHRLEIKSERAILSREEDDHLSDLMEILNFYGRHCDYGRVSGIGNNDGLHPERDFSPAFAENYR